MQQSKSGKIIQSVQRAVDIINCFDDVNTELSLGHISQTLDLNKSTVHGILNTLHTNGFVRQNISGKYMIGQALTNKYRYAGSANRVLLYEEAKEYMENIAEKYRVNSSLFIFQQGELSLINRILPSNVIYTINCASKSDPKPYHCTASGKIFLLYMTPKELEDFFKTDNLVPSSEFSMTTREQIMQNLEQIRIDGYSYEDGELGEGVAAISVPMIVPSTGKLFATISATGLSLHIERCKEDLVGALKHAATEITLRIFK